MADYSQIKVSVDPAVASRFKAYCRDSGLSMAGELSRLMSACSKSSANPAFLPIDTRRQRRNALIAVILALQRIRDAEAAYCSNIPDNLRSAPAFDASESSIDALDAAIDCLSDAF
jgi:hypothetical protein